MSSSAESIFELSLSEKLQLVEDLWGRYLYARSGPRARLAKEVAGEDRISLAIRAQRSRGKKFSAEFAVGMVAEMLT